MIYTGRKGLEIYSANLPIKVGGLAHSSFLVLITCRDVSNECNYARPRSAPYGLCQDDNDRRYVRGRKNEKSSFSSV